MAGKTLRVDVVSPTGVVWSGEASQVSVPSEAGSLGVLPGREPVLAVLRPGDVRVFADGQSQDLPISGGFVSVDDDVVTVVTSDPKALADFAAEQAAVAEEA